jgi:hypothetical protein
MTRADWNADRAEEAADISLGSAQVAVTAAGKVLDAMPTPDVRDDPRCDIIRASRDEEAGDDHHR